MSALGIRGGLRRHRRNLALIAAVIALVGATAAHHSGMLHDDGAMSAVAQMCLGIVAAAGAAMLTIGLAALLLERPRARPLPMAAGALCVPAVPVARARHGPAAVWALCVDRR